MKKILSKIGSFFDTVFALIFALIFGVCVVFYLPIDYIKYKRSYYYKNERKKYSLFAASGMHFELYNLIAKNNLPIKYVKNPKDDSLDCGWFVFGDTLLIIDDWGFEYDDKSGEWIHTEYLDDDGEPQEEIKMPLCEFFKTEIDEANELAGETICTKAVVLLDGDIFDGAELAKQQEGFLVYNDNLVETLKTFCEKG
jgi:hypothetical protein